MFRGCENKGREKDEMKKGGSRREGDGEDKEMEKELNGRVRKKERGKNL